MTFTPSRLTVARNRRGLSKTALAKLVGLTARSISAYESGDTVPTADTLASLADALAFPSAFFSMPDIDEPVPAGASFRVLTRMTAGQRDSALAAGAIAIQLSGWIDQRFDLPDVRVPDLRGYEPEAAAEALRAHWDLGQRSIRNMVHVLEAHGVRVFSLAEECAEVDAFSFWRNDRPFVFLNTMKSAERSRFDAAHELGHLTLHRHGGPRGRAAEHEADQFASGFLMPRGTVLATAPRVPSLRRLVELKKNWNVSVAALAHRLHAVGVLSEWHYRQLCIDMNQRGYRKREPEGTQRETSQVLSKVLKALRAEGITKQAIAKELGLPAEEVETLVFGLALVSVEGGHDNADAKTSAPNLRLV